MYLTLQEPGDGVEPRRFVGQVERVVAQRFGGAGGGGTQAGAGEAGPVRGKGVTERSSVTNLIVSKLYRHPRSFVSKIYIIYSCLMIQQEGLITGAQRRPSKRSAQFATVLVLIRLCGYFFVNISKKAAFCSSLLILDFGSIK